MGEQDQREQVGSEERVTREERIAEGVSLRRNAAGKATSIRIAFEYRGEECRERLRGLAPTKGNQAFAIRRRGEIVNKIARGEFNYADEFPNSKNAKRFGAMPTDRTIGDAFDEQQRIWSGPEGGIGSVEPSTWLGYHKLIERHLRPWFGKTRVRDLSAGQIQAEILAVPGITLKTARNILSPLNVVLEREVAFSGLQANPLDRVKLNVIWPKDRRSTDWVPDPFAFEEMLAIFGACRDDEEADYWRAAFGTGMRTSEQIILPWPHVDLVALAGVKVEVAEVLGIDGMARKGPKTDAGRRVIPFTAGALEALQRQHERTGGMGGRVFRDTRYMSPWRGDQPLRKRWTRILAKAEVRYRNPYQTRHTFASVHLAAGRSVLQVAKWMGHETVEMLQRHYGRWIEQGEDPANRAALAEFFHVAGGHQAQILRIA